MQITFLGTGTSQGVPIIACPCKVCRSRNPKDKRFRSSIMIEHSGKIFVIDSGPDFRQQMLREKVKRLDALIFTHEHKDHTAGMDDIRAFNYVLKKKIDVYATERVQRSLEKEFDYIFHPDKYPGIPQLRMHTLTNKPATIKGLRFIPIELKHLHLPVFGFRIGDFTYITDANFISEKEKEKIRGSKIIVINALRKEKHISHFNLDEAMKILEELKPDRGYLTHISHQLGLHEEVNKQLPSFIRCAYDGMKLKI